MKHPSPADIEEMRRRGYDVSTIREAEERSKRWHVAQALIRQIQSAFEGVTLGNGVGLLEAQALDGYGSVEECAAARVHDEKIDWRRISSKALNDCSSSLSFFDAEGMRFHLPAFLIAEIEGTFRHTVSYHVSTAKKGRNRFALLSEAQRAAVLAFIDYMTEEHVSDYVAEDMSKARGEYWSKE